MPFVTFYWLLASTLLAFGQGDIDSPGGWVAFGVAVVATAGLAVVAWRGLQAGPAIDNAMSQGLGADWRSHIDPEMAARLRRRLPFARILFGPFLVRRRDVEREANIRYGDAGASNLLDVYRHRSHPSGGPTLIHLHGGAFVGGKKNNESRPLIYRLASQGWLCISANYRLSPAASFPDHLIDVKKVIAWVREHGHEYGADPAVVFVAGSSAGAHLAALAALTPNDPAFQPGFEHADTSVTAAIGLYGYYGPLDAQQATPLVTCGVRRTRGPAVLHRARRPGHEGACAGCATVRGEVAEHLVTSGCLHRAARGAALVRPVPFPSLRSRRGCDRGIRRLGAVAGWRSSVGS